MEAGEAVELTAVPGAPSTLPPGVLPVNSEGREVAAEAGDGPPSPAEARDPRAGCGNPVGSDSAAVVVAVDPPHTSEVCRSPTEHDTLLDRGSREPAPSSLVPEGRGSALLQAQSHEQQLQALEDSAVMLHMLSERVCNQLVEQARLLEGLDGEVEDSSAAFEGATDGARSLLHDYGMTEACCVVAAVFLVLAVGVYALFGHEW